MKRTKTKTEITIEKRQRTTIRLRRQSVVWCEQCAAQVQMLMPEEAAAFVQTTARDIFRRIEAGQVHFLEISSGGLLVCRRSVSTVSADQTFQKKQ